MIRSITSGLGGQLKEDKSLLSKMDESFGNTKKQISEVMGRMDEVIGKASHSIWCYVLIFTIMIVAILWKMT